MSDFNIIRFSDYKFLSKHFDKLSEEYKLANPQFQFTKEFIKLGGETTLLLNLSYDDCLETLNLKKQELLLKNDDSFIAKDQKYFLILNNKKIRFLKTLHSEIKARYDLDLLSKKLTWVILLVDSLVKWDHFVTLLLNKQIEKPKDTRPLKGFKPYKVNSKIIYNRNGRR